MSDLKRKLPQWNAASSGPTSLNAGNGDSSRPIAGAGYAGGGGRVADVRLKNEPGTPGTPRVKVEPGHDGNGEAGRVKLENGSGRDVVVKQEAGGGVRVKNEPGVRVKSENASLAPSAIGTKNFHARNTLPGGPGGGMGMGMTFGIGVRDARTAALDFISKLKQRGTMGSHDVYFELQESCPGLDHEEILQYVRKGERVVFHPANGVYEYKPEQQFTTAAQMLAYIRPRASLTQSLNVKLLRDMVPQDKGVPSANDMLTALEDRGDVLLMRTLGPWRDMKFPTLGQKNSRGLGLLDQPLQGTDGEPGGNPGARYKAVFYDDVRVERAGKGLMPLKRLDTELIKNWAEVELKEDDDVLQLLRNHDLSASSNVPEAVKPAATGPQQKKKKRTNRALKITNTHMKQYGIDFSKDFEGP